MESTKSKISVLLDDVTTLVEKKSDLFLLTATEKTSRLTSSIVWGVLLVLVMVLMLVFGSTALAWWLGERMESIPIGFCIVTGLYLFMFLALFWFAKKTIQNGITSIFIKKILHDN